VSARLSVEELEDLFGVSIDAEDVETVGGLLAHQLGKVPIAGSVATVSGLRLTAENLTGRRNRIGTVLVQPAGEVGELAGTPAAAVRQAPAETGGNGSNGTTKAGNGVGVTRKPSE
jgi:Transporter associated domain